MLEHEIGRFGYHKNDVVTNLKFLFSPDAKRIKSSLSVIEDNSPYQDSADKILRTAKSISKDPEEVAIILEGFAHLFQQLNYEGFTTKKLYNFKMDQTEQKVFAPHIIGIVFL